MYRRNNNGLVLVMAIVFGLAFAGWFGTRIVNGIIFDINVEGYLKRAADSNTVDLAKNNLNAAVSYIEENGMTSGYTSIFYKTPNEDVGFWYQNLKASQKELADVRPEASQLEKSNVLMKLRETLLDNVKEGVAVTVPPGIVVFPHNLLFSVWGFVSGFFALYFGLVVFLRNFY